MKRWLTFALLFLLLACSVGESPARKAESSRRAAPVIRLADKFGTQRSLEDYRGKVVVLNFWAPWCFACKEELKALSEIRDYFDGSAFEVLGVAVLEGGQAIPENSYSFPVLLDTANNAARAYDVSMLPVTFVIDKQGRIAEFPDPSGGGIATRFSGPRGWNALGTVRALEELIRE